VQLPITILIDRTRLLAKLLCRGDIVALTLCADGRLRIERNDGSLDEAVVDSGSTVYSDLVILRMRLNGQVESMVLPRAAIGRDRHRQLRVWLKWRATVAG